MPKLDILVERVIINDVRINIGTLHEQNAIKEW